MTRACFDGEQQAIAPFMVLSWQRKWRSRSTLRRILQRSGKAILSAIRPHFMRESLAQIASASGEAGEAEAIFSDSAMF
ncbi:hypothetical protein NG799_17435 [Laspinema sp. D1]|uniref:Uncharacterized protein n=1 Tax=Laspinema palackyanum D2a TaxID=2953684 RepID=A0ABT2MTM4_9CYAN|nr:hypothetical protein [Laspinema sp. D2b]MCT7968098.1 hypothetical protein [Laspinema sp. D2a]